MARDYKNPLFSIHRYDYEGDLHEAGVFLILGDCVQLKFDDPSDVQAFGERILNMLPELTEAWKDCS